MFGFAFPIALSIIWGKKKKVKAWPFICGAIIFLIFAMGLEQILHYFCLIQDNSLSKFITGSAVLFSIYAGLAAGIFEEAGRLFAFKVLLKKYKEREVSVAYGIGHGGIEVIVVFGISYLTYLIWSLYPETASLPEYATLLCTITPGICAVAIVERLMAMALHIGFSIIVFYGVKHDVKWFFIALLIHVLTDIPAGLYQYGVLPVWSVEVWSAVMMIITVSIGIKLYRRMKPVLQTVDI